MEMVIKSSGMRNTAMNVNFSSDYNKDNKFWRETK